MIALVAAVALLVAGCGSGGDGAGDSSGSDSAEGSADDGVGSELLLSSRDAQFSFMQQSLFPPPIYQQTIKECMNAQGFDYLVPQPPEFLIPMSDLTRILDDVANLDPTSSRYRNRYGYGVTTVDALMFSAIPFGDDPNAAILQQMTPSEQDAWYNALYGPSEAEFLEDPTYEPTEEEIFEMLESRGCTREGEDAAGTGFDFEQMQQEGLAFEESYQRIQSSEGFVEIEQNWAACVAEQGFGDLTSFDSLVEMLWEKLEEIRAPDPFEALSEEDWVNMTESEYMEILGSMGPAYDLDELAALQQEELDIAQRLKDCDVAYWTGFAELENQLSPAS